MKFVAVATASLLAIVPVAQADNAAGLGAQVNEYLAASGLNVRLEYMEYYTAPDSGELGRTVFFSDRGNKQIAFGQFVPGDVNRAPWSNGDPDSIDWSYNTTYLTGDVTPAEQKTAHYNAMATWDNLTCSEYGLTASDVANSGVVLAILTGGFLGSFDPTADIMHNGFVPRAFFDAIAPPNGGDFILGVSFTFIFIDGSGNPLDSNNDGYADKAFGDNYYNDEFTWNIGSTFDIETVVLHEAGHGHGQAHFGEAFRSGGNGKLHFNPRAVMNAAYSGVQTSITRTDNAGHCAGWANWPNR
jgi:hypothetical protein